MKLSELSAGMRFDFAGFDTLIDDDLKALCEDLTHQIRTHLLWYLPDVKRLPFKEIFNWVIEVHSKASRLSPEDIRPIAEKNRNANISISLYESLIDQNGELHTMLLAKEEDSGKLFNYCSNSLEHLKHLGYDGLVEAASSKPIRANCFNPECLGSYEGLQEAVFGYWAHIVRAACLLQTILEVRESIVPERTYCLLRGLLDGFFNEKGPAPGMPEHLAGNC